MNTVEEIERAIPTLSEAEVLEIRDWIDDYLEDRLELTDEVVSKLNRARSEIESGQFTTRQPD